MKQENGLTREQIIKLITDELDNANEKFPLFASTWEGAAILREEHDEFWDEVRKQKKGDYISSAMVTEVVQVGAMCIKFLESIPWHGKNKV